MSDLKILMLSNAEKLPASFSPRSSTLLYLKLKVTNVSKIEHLSVRQRQITHGHMLLV